MPVLFHLSVPSLHRNYLDWHHSWTELNNKTLQVLHKFSFNPRPPPLPEFNSSKVACDPGAQATVLAVAKAVWINRLESRISGGPRVLCNLAELNWAGCRHVRLLIPPNHIIESIFQTPFPSLTYLRLTSLTWEDFNYSAEKDQFPPPNCFCMSLKDTVADPLLLAFCWAGCSFHPVMYITYRRTKCTVTGIVCETG